MTKKFIYFATSAVILTLFAGLVYASVQQNFRQSANDPQIQLSEDIATKLAQGSEPTSLVPSEKVDLSKSLAPFVIIYNKNGEIVSTNASLNDKSPNLPKGVLDAARNSQNRLTWQPASKVREAVVITYFKDKAEGFVLVARSLREVEVREEMLTLQVFGVWAVALLFSFVGFFLLPLRFK